MAWPTDRLVNFAIKSQIASSFLNEFQDKAKANEIATNENTINRLTTIKRMNLPLTEAAIISPSTSAGISRHLNRIESDGTNIVQFGVEIPISTGGAVSGPGAIKLSEVRITGTKTGTSNLSLTIDSYNNITGVADTQVASSTVSASGAFTEVMQINTIANIGKRYVVGFSTPSGEITQIFGLSVLIQMF